jgi:hypothetical protein
MKTIAQKAWVPSYQATSVTSLWDRFINWCKTQEKNRLEWLAIGLAGHGCIITPLAVFTIMISGNNLFFWITAMVAMGATLIVNLAAMPAKITIPVFLLSIVIDIMIVILALANGF